MSAAPVIQLKDIHTVFGKLAVHRGISLELRRGQILGIVGKSGSGKTTLMREMIGLQAPTRGEVRLFGERLAAVGPRQLAQLHQRCGFLFQGGALFSAFNVFDNVAFPLRESRFVEEKLIRQLVRMKIGMVGLTQDAVGLLPSQLSGGMTKRAALARALALEPELLLLDEPTSGLDPVASEEFMTLLATLHRELAFTAVIVTHDLEVMHELCDLLAVLDDGRLLAFAPPAEVYASAEPSLHEFFHGAVAERIFTAQLGSRE
ncbi:MAG TPA: ATP-binding cassette domain-containing protein [Gammaproteobacteria bacterium]|jgi:phospholipid/cholesterol/gamma-HCH transport system ATP-binding protein